MPSAPIPFGNMQASGDEQLAGASPLAINVFVDGKGAVRRRPCTSTWAGFPSTSPDNASIIGMHQFNGDLYYCTDARNLYKVVPTTQVVTPLSNATLTTKLAGAARPVFAETAFRLVATGGADPQKVEAGVSDRLGGTPPASSAFIAALGARLFVNDATSSSTTNQIRFSGSGSTGNEAWDPLDYVSADARPDAIVALYENTNEMFVFGETTLQVFSADPIAVIAPGRTLNIGCSAPYSVIRVDEQFAWMDEARNFIISDGRSRNVISDPIAKTLDDITTASDCYGFRINYDQLDCLVWQFPTDGRTFAYQINGGWSQWQGFTYGVGHTSFPIKSHYYWPSMNLHLAGLDNGQIARLSTNRTNDINSQPVKCEVRTGFINRDTDALKECQSIRFIFKRGSSATGATALVSWRDDYGAFGQAMALDLGSTGDYVATIERRSLGTYRQRQWKLEMSDAADLTLARVEETYNVLAN